MENKRNQGALGSAALLCKAPLLWQFDGGYVELDANGAPTSWNYYITDHLGSRDQRGRFFVITYFRDCFGAKELLSVFANELPIIWISGDGSL